MSADPILGLLVQAYGRREGRRIWGAYRLAQTAVEQARTLEGIQVGLVPAAGAAQQPAVDPRAGSDAAPDAGRDAATTAGVVAPPAEAGRAAVVAGVGAGAARVAASSDGVANGRLHDDTSKGEER